MKELTLLFLVKDNSVLLAMKKRGFGEGRWNGVGGKLDNGESVEEALIRESQEEIGVTPTRYKKIAQIVFHEQHEGDLKTMLVHVFTSTSWQGEPVETEEMAPKWFKISEIPYEDMWADDPYWLPDVLNGKQLSCEFHLDENDKVNEYSITEVTNFE